MAALRSGLQGETVERGRRWRGGRREEDAVWCGSGGRHSANLEGIQHTLSYSHTHTTHPVLRSTARSLPESLERPGGRARDSGQRAPDGVSRAKWQLTACGAGGTGAPTRHDRCCGSRSARAIFSLSSGRVCSGSRVTHPRCTCPSGPRTGDAVTCRCRALAQTRAKHLERTVKCSRVSPNESTTWYAHFYSRRRFVLKWNSPSPCSFYYKGKPLSLLLSHSRYPLPSAHLLSLEGEEPAPVVFSSPLLRAVRFLEHSPCVALDSFFSLEKKKKSLRMAGFTRSFSRRFRGARVPLSSRKTPCGLIWTCVKLRFSHRFV